MSGTWTPLREHNVWWSQETYCVHQLDNIKDICGWASFSFIVTVTSNYILYYSHSNYLCPALLEIVSTKYTSLLSSRFLFNLPTRVPAKKSKLSLY